jgi:anti-sigma factor RsiW
MARPQPDDLILMAYADGELDAQAAAELEAALAADPALADRVAMFVQSAEMLREAMGEPEAVAIPPSLHRQIRKFMWMTRARKSARLALPVAAAIAGFVIGGAHVPNMSAWIGDANATRAEAVMHEVAEYHTVFLREDEHLVEVPATRKDHIEAWLGDRVGFPLRVPDLSGRGLTFLGGRMLVVEGRPVAQIMYGTADGQRIALCAIEQKTGKASGLVKHSEDGLDLYAKGDGRHLFILVGPAASTVVRDLTSEMTTLLRHG